MNTVSISKSDIPKQKVILVFGPTAAGKTEIVDRLFGSIGEVISADSMQAYRGLDVGTAKPDKKLQSRLTHHLIDIRNPDEQYNAGQFVVSADETIKGIAARGKVAVVSGGTPFYLRNFIYGLPDTPPSDPAVREQIALEIEESGIDAAYERLAEVDPQAAEKISRRDAYRIERALEVYRVTGRRLSSFKVSQTRRTNYDMLLIGLDRPREELNKRIEYRVEMMFEQGLVREVASLIAAGFGEEAPGMQGIGYREFFHMLKDGCLLLSGVRKEIVRNTRKFAKRQRTFFKRFPETLWFHPKEIDAISEKINQFLG